jgi:hypothetical protein
MTLALKSADRCFAAESHRAIVQCLHVPGERDVLGHRMHVAPGTLQRIVQREPASAGDRQQALDCLHAELDRVPDIEPVAHARIVVGQRTQASHVVDPAAIDLQQRACCDLGCCLGETKLDRRLVGELDGGNRGLAGQLVADLIERALCRAERSAHQAVGESREQRQRIEVALVGFGARRAAVARRHHRQQAVRRRERVRHDDIVAAGRGEADRVPDVLDVVLAAIEEHEMLLRRLVSLRHHGEQDHALTMIDVAGEAPAAAQTNAGAMAAHRRSDRQERTRHGSRGLGVPQLVLRLAWKHAEDPPMARGDARGPSARHATARRFRRQHGVQPVAAFHAAVPRRLQRTAETGPAKVAVGGVGNAPDALGFGGPLAQHRHQRPRLGDQRRLDFAPFSRRSDGTMAQITRAHVHV